MAERESGGFTPELVERVVTAMVGRGWDPEDGTIQVLVSDVLEASGIAELTEALRHIAVLVNAGSIEGLTKEAVAALDTADEVCARLYPGFRSKYNLCDGCGWVCENHPSLSWEPESDSPYSCGCGAGMPCPGCKACPPPSLAKIGVNHG